MISKKVKIYCFFKQCLDSANVLFHLSDRSKELQSLTFLNKLFFALWWISTGRSEESGHFLSID